MAVSAASGPLSWADVLDHVAQMLRDAEAEALRAEQALPPPTPALLDVPASHKRLEQAFQAMQQCLAHAERVAADADAACQSSEAALASWLAQLETSRSR